MNTRSIAVLLAVVLCGCVTLGAHNDPEQVSPAVVDDESTSATPVAANPTELLRCQRACKDGQEAVITFCRSIPDPRIKGPCWVASMAGLIACINFCYNFWGS